MKKSITLFTAILSVFFLLIGCNAKGNDKASATKTEKGKEKIEITDLSGRKVTFDKTPESFATLSMGDMDIIHALGGKIIGRPDTKLTLPEELKKAQVIGNAHQPNFEKIASLKPDVLVANNGFQKNVPTVEGQGTKVVISTVNSVQDIQKNIEIYGAVMKKEEKAKELNQKINDQMKKYEKKSDVKALLVYGAPGTYLAALPTSLSGDILEKTGGKNIAAGFPEMKEYPQYAQLSVERIIEANPDVIYLITHGDPNSVKKAFEGEMMKNEAWKNLDAVKQNRVVILPPDLFGSNPGTKVTEAMDFMYKSIQDVRK
ncbi:MULTISPECIES: ABC transporter substrate-binding protein [Bacillus cereus group]|uniref:helical backbone metal receptor n=1 Tax=Bacillus cereus group TaxID=86661 RepID=UPI0001A0C095|nr:MULTISPECIES: ABC transporter substrate-binding protein [Bacillus cereus group]EEL32651.1 Iron compound ABC transporter, iron compound-binding protein [Bacillus cereus Rock3-28]MBJ7948727.1 ABC transporter substrate-binding protein [Bacillus cereus group sp. N24]OSM12682.1 iron-hydroxamate ABC transporter substrate-binding protein [Bacillus toyonensis]UFH96884.1 ABC transporter substrate-binding protein [Bacillus toyonensis]UKS59421.1 ABC transporter substrate-binding protein [Bacillus toyo